MFQLMFGFVMGDSNNHNFVSNHGSTKEKYNKLSSSGSLFFLSGFQIIAQSKLGYDLTIRKYNPSSK